MNWRLEMAINSQEFKTLTIGNQSFEIAGSNVKQQYPALYTYLNAMMLSAATLFADKVKNANDLFNDGLVSYRSDISDGFAQGVMKRLNIETNCRSHAIFYRLAFMYLLTYIPPFTQQVRETKNGWVSPENWGVVKIHETELQNLIIECEKTAQITFEK